MVTTPPTDAAGTQPQPETPPFGAEDLIEKNPSLFDPEAPGPTLDQSLVDESAPGPTVPAEWFDTDAPGPNVPAEWFDTAAPGPTVDLSMLEDTNTLDMVAEAAQDPTADPNEFVQSRIEPSGVTEPAGVTEPSLTETGVSEPSPRDQDLDDIVNP